MRVVLDEDIPRGLTPFFGAAGYSVQHVEEIGLRGTRNSVLLAALSGNADVLVTGDTDLGHQQNLRKVDLAVILIHPRRLVVEQLVPLIPLVVAATIGLPKTRRRTPRPAEQ